ncbi:MAG: hypothetical protein QNJ63_30750, partial [Calothrix sp. MO_192.B10]|nr:hypothetical protein [Calothrix sp. MO_192.B10]
MINSLKIEDIKQLNSNFAPNFESVFNKIDLSTLRLNNNLALIEFFRKRVNELLNNYYPKEHILHQPLNRALFYSR